MQRIYSKRHLRRLAQKEKQKLQESERMQKEEEILGNSDFTVETVGNFEVIYDNLQIKPEHDDLPITTNSEEEETTAGSNYCAPKTGNYQVLNESSYPDPRTGNNSSWCQMQLMVKKTIDDRFEMLENKINDYVDSKVSTIIKTQEEISAMLKQIINKNTSIPTEVIFPIKTEEQLRSVNERMQFDDDLHVSTLRALLLPGGIKKNLQNIIDLNLLSEFNVDGILGKKPFKEYAAFVHGIYRAVKCEGMTEVAFIADLRTAFKLNKNKFFKFKSRMKKQRNKHVGSPPRPKFSFVEMHRIKKMKLNGTTTSTAISNEAVSIENSASTRQSEDHSNS